VKKTTKFASKPLLNKEASPQNKGVAKKKKQPSELSQLFTMPKKGPTL
jgi:hypothetical protein